MTTAQRKTTAALVGLAVTVGAVALILLDTSALVDILSMLFGALGFFLAVWQMWQGSSSSASTTDPLADQLARRVQAQCDVDALANDLNALQLRVHWKKASADLTDRTGGGIDADLLDGDWAEVTAQYQRIPTGRWVVLGDGGAGKSALMLHLMRLLLENRSAGSAERVPVLVPLSAWNPAQQVQSFLVSYLVEQFPGLQPPGAKPQDGDQTALAELVRDLILPVFDGLDEMDESLRAQALDELSRQRETFPFVLTSRSDAFADAVKARGAGLARAAVVTLVPLGLEEIEQYLCEVPHSDSAEWSEVLRESVPLAEALSTPLMVWLAGASYAAKPRELVAGAQPQKDEITDRLLDALIPARFARDSRWNAEDVEHWLTYLACEVERRKEQAKAQPVPAGGVSSESGELAGRIAWWRLADAAEPLVGRVAGVAALLTTGGAAGLGVGYLFGFWPGAITGLVLGLLVARGTARSRLEPTTVELRLGMRLPVGLAAGLFTGLIGGGAVWVANHDLTAVWALAGFGIPLGIVYGMTTPVDVDHATSPSTVLKRERTFVLSYAIAYGLACGIVGWALADPVFGIVLGVITALSGGLFNGLPWLVVHKLSRAEKAHSKAGAVAWFRYFLAKLTWLGSPPVLPWRLMTFLEDARRRGVLRQVGARYEFRHRRLSERLEFKATGGPTTAVSRGHGSPRTGGVPAN